MVTSEKVEPEVPRPFLENVVVLAVCWALSHVNWMVFNSLGVQPMPFWPASGVALVAGYYYGWRIAPGLALSTILADHYSLGAPWSFAAAISVMDTVGPLLAADIIRRRVQGKSWLTWNRGDITVAFLAGIVFASVLSAIGGIGSKWGLGMMPFEAVPQGLLRWSLAHGLGALILAPPLFILLARDRKP